MTIQKPKFMEITKIAKIITENVPSFIKGDPNYTEVEYDEQEKGFQVILNYVSKDNIETTVLANKLIEVVAYDLSDYVNYALASDKLRAALYLISTNADFEGTDIEGIEDDQELFEYLIEEATFFTTPREYMHYMNEDASEGATYEYLLHIADWQITDEIVQAGSIANYLMLQHEGIYDTPFGAFYIR